MVLTSVEEGSGPGLMAAACNQGLNIKLGRHDVTHLKDCTHAFLAGKSVSQIATFLPSWLWPAVARTEELPPWNTMSAVFLLWVGRLK